jgi:DNA-binding IclR family transcriptional regulator
MSRKTPAVDRIVSILNLVVDHPEQAFTLTQIVSALKLSRATCHSMLMGLVDAGYLYRAPDKSYMIGPALISLAVSAQRHFSPLAVARQEMRRLADEFDVVAAAIFHEGDSLVVRDRAASLSHLGQSIPFGQRFPLRPARNFFLLNFSEAELDGELKRMRPRLSPKERTNALSVLAFVREHGFMIGADADEPDDDDGFLHEDGGRFITRLNPKAEYRLRFLLAPVLNERGQVEFGITMWGFLRPLTGAEAAKIGQRLVESCRQVTNFIAGRHERPAPSAAPPIRLAASRR